MAKETEPKQVKTTRGLIAALEQQLAQRDAELAILNSVGEAMAQTLDVKTVTKIVGDKVRDSLPFTAVSTLLLNAQTNRIHMYCEYDAGERFQQFLPGETHLDESIQAP